MAVSVQESILSGRTLNIRDLNEVIALLERHHINKTSYYQLGLRLLLSDNTLRSIEQEHRGQVGRCFTECLVSWLRKADGVDNQTIDTLIAALRGTGENAIADSITGEIQISRSEIINYDRPTATPTLEVNENHSDQPMILGVHVYEMENKMKSQPELHPIAFSLQQKYCDLVADVRQSLIDHKIDIEGIKLMIKAYLTGETRDHPMLKKHIDLLQKIHDFNSLFHFLIDNHFIGYLNYYLLKRISKRISQDVSLMNQVDDYEKKYAELLNEISCDGLVHLFNEWSHLSPNTPIGLPCISFRLGSPWLHSRFYTWVSTFGEFSWSYYAFLKQLRKNCVIITYAILPCVLDDVMRDLKDPVILKKLEDKGVTVIELLQEEEEDFEGIEEDPQIESTAKAEPRAGASSIIQTTLSEGNIPTTSTTTLRPEAASIRKEVKSSSLGRDLIKSIESHAKPEEVIGLLEAGADPNATKYAASGDHPALIIAIKKDNIDIVKLLLEKGADPNVTEYTFGGNPALIAAIEKHNFKIVEVLLEKGADPNIGFDIYKGTPLHHASKTGDANIIKLLITKGKADVNAVNERKRTPLFNAVASGSVEAVDILLTNGARTDVVSKYFGTPLHYAAGRKKTKIIKLLITKGKADVNAVNEYNETPLLKAVKSGSVEVVDILLTNGARTNVSKYGETPLLSAVKHGRSPQIIKLLITKGGADVTAACKEYHINPELSRSEIAEVLITKIPRSMSLHEMHEYDFEMLIDEPSMSSRWPERKQLSTFSTSHYDDEMSAELTKESAYSPHSSTAGQGEVKRCDIL